MVTMRSHLIRAMAQSDFVEALLAPSERPHLACFPPRRRDRGAQLLAAMLAILLDQAEDEENHGRCRRIDNDFVLGG